MRPGSEIRKEWNTIANYFPSISNSVPIVIVRGDKNIVHVHTLEKDNHIEKTLSLSVNLLKQLNRECGHTFTSIKFITDKERIELKGEEIINYIKDEFNAIEIKE